MVPINYSIIALELNRQIRTGRIAERIPPFRRLAKEFGCSGRTLELAFAPFRRCGAVTRLNARRLRLDRTKLPEYSIGIIADFTPSPTYDDSGFQELFAMIRDHGGTPVLISISGHVKPLQYPLLATLDSVCFASAIQLTPELCDFLNQLSVPFVTSGNQPGCTVTDYVNHGNFEAESALLQQLLKLGFVRVELWHPAVQYGENETRHRRWLYLKKKLGASLCSGDFIRYDWQNDTAANFRQYFEFHHQRKDWPDAVIFWHGLQHKMKKVHAEFASRIPEKTLMLMCCNRQLPLPEGFTPFIMEDYLAEERRLFASILFRRLLFPEHPPMRYTLPLKLRCDFLDHFHFNLNKALT